MGNKIFLIGDDKALRPMSEQPYESEDVLQELLENYPDLLVGDQMDAERPRRWLLVKREMAVPDAADAAGRWSLDHLFLDQDGVLTLVEVKRATDTRARREVVAQMLDYAANAVLYWPVEQIITAFEATARGGGRDPEEVLAEFLATDASPGDPRPAGEAFWGRVKTALDAERIRMVFVADVIPRELQRIVEFLNDQMNPAEVIAVEVKQFVGQNVRTLVPHVVGQTVKSAAKSAPRGGQDWERESFMERARAEGGGHAAEVAERLIEWFTANAAGVRWGRGKSATFTARAMIHGEDTEVLRVFADGTVMVSFGRIEDEGTRAELRSRLTKIEGVELKSASGYPSVSLSLLADEDSWGKFTDTYTWLLGTLSG